MNFVIHMLHLFVFLQMFLGHVHCSRTSILFCFTCNMFSFVVGVSLDHKTNCWLFSCGWICLWILRLVVDFLWLELCPIHFVIIFHMCI
jgi:ABC-type microcin C transport system permease subunit YejE